MSERRLHLVREADIDGLLDEADAYTATEACFIEMARSSGRNFPVVREGVGAGSAFGIKSGVSQSFDLLGLKAGGYWPGNEKIGRANHQSVIVLFNPATGEPRAILSANRLTALRTAAAAAISAKVLARADSRVLGVVGAGKQALGHTRAICNALPIERILIANRTPAAAKALAERLSADGMFAEQTDLETLSRRADVIVTVTSSREPLIVADWIKPGTHIAAMGSDTVGKQELDARLLSRAGVFTDEIAQAFALGEAQHARSALGPRDLTPLGDVLMGRLPGRADDKQITIFDGTGVALQDLAVAGLALERAIERGLAVEVAI